MTDEEWIADIEVSIINKAENAHILDWYYDWEGTVFLTVVLGVLPQVVNFLVCWFILRH